MSTASPWRRTRRRSLPDEAVHQGRVHNAGVPWGEVTRLELASARDFAGRHNTGQLAVAQKAGQAVPPL